MTVEIRELSGHASMAALRDCFTQIWGFTDEQELPKELFVGAQIAGQQVLGAYDGDTMIGGSWGFFTWDGSALGLHSHITGVAPAYRGVAGYALKMAQRDWCLARDISTVTWTFDPMIARNAAFNLRKLRATGVTFLPNFYGSMSDRFNAGEPTDRIEVRWDLTRPPRVAPPAGASQTVAIPQDYLALRESDPAAARAQRAAATDRMGALFAAGYQATWFDTGRGYVFTSPAEPSR